MSQNNERNFFEEDSRQEYVAACVFIAKFRDSLVERSIEEKKEFAKAVDFVEEHFEAYYQAVSTLTLQNLRMLEPEGTMLRWSQVLTSPKCTPPRLTGETPTEEMFNKLASALYEGYTTVAGCHEECVVYNDRVEETLQQLFVHFKIGILVDKEATMKTLFEATLPADFIKVRFDCRTYLAQFQRRVNTYDKAKQILNQIKETNFSTPKGPNLVTHNTETPAALGKSGRSRFS